MMFLTDLRADSEMKQYKIFMTEPAVDDLQKIVVYISNELREPSIARKLLGKIKEATMSLSDMPMRYALVSDERLTLQDVRKLMVDIYIVFYIISEKEKLVTVIRILYGRRDWLLLL